MIDIHCHILPGIDDGADTLETSLAMIKLAEADGTRKMIATPHYYRGTYDNYYEDVLLKVHELNSLLVEREIPVEVFPGQEVFIDQCTLEDYKKTLIQKIHNTQYMLVEFPMDRLPKYSLDILYELQVQGVKPILAHPERYLYFIEKPSLINDFIQEKILFQLNSGSITGLFGSKVQKTAEVFLMHQLCHFIASDAHTPRKRCPGISTSLKRVEEIQKEMSKRILMNAERLLSNESIHQSLERIKEKKRLFSFFNR